MTGQQTHTANAQQSYTLASRTSQRTDQSLPKSMPAPTQEKIQNIFSCLSKKIKTPDTQTNTTKTRKLNNDNGLQGQKTRTTGYNTVLPKWRQKSYYETFVQGSTVKLLLSFSAINPPLRQYPNRWAQLNGALNK